MKIGHYPYKKCSTLGTMNLSNLISRDNWTFQSQERRCHVTKINLGPSLSVEKIKMSRPPSKGTRSNLPLRGWTSPSNPHPLRALPPRHGVYIDRCITRACRGLLLDIANPRERFFIWPFL